jgi:hypothetical protein
VFARSLSLKGRSEISVAKQMSSDFYSAGSDLPSASIFLRCFTMTTWVDEVIEATFRLGPHSQVFS